jgi:DNA-directed RNA polymerase subunit alpha
MRNSSPSPLSAASIEGSAVTSVKIDSVLHEFGTIDGVQEDVTDIILNIKNLVLSSHSRAAKTIYIKKDKTGAITGRDIMTDGTVEVLNPDLHIATLTKDVKFHLEMEVAAGMSPQRPTRRKTRLSARSRLIPLFLLLKKWFTASRTPAWARGPIMTA